MGLAYESLLPDTHQPTTPGVSMSQKTEELCLQVSKDGTSHSRGRPGSAAPGA